MIHYSKVAYVRLVMAFVIVSIIQTIPLAAQSNQASTEASTPNLLIGIIIDTHAHQRRTIEFEQTALASILTTFPNSRVFVLRYAERTHLVQDWTIADEIPPDLKQSVKIDPHSDPRKGAALWDSFKIAIPKLNAENAPLKALIIIGEGNDGASTTRYVDVRKMAKQSSIPCFALFVADHSRRGGRILFYGFDLQSLTSATHGASYDLGTNQMSLRSAMADLSKRIGNREKKHHWIF